MARQPRRAELLGDLVHPLHHRDADARVALEPVPSVDRDAPRALIEPYVRDLKITFPILLDPEMATADAWRVTGLPATFVIRPGGEVVGMAFGAREWDSAEMTALLEALLPDH